jgi:ubiquinone/menaquinone biosynthesis C-methylase UbiE
MNKLSRDLVIRANIDIHTAYAAVYNNQPHFRPENQKKVREIMRDLRSRIPQPRASFLDMACGTGFLLHLASDIFDELHGVDVTKAMTDQVDLTRGNITVHNCTVESTPFGGEYFDVVAAYSFMDHLYDLKPFLQEVFRVLKPGGIFYSDQNANKEFWDALAKLPESHPYDPIVRREIRAALQTDEDLVKYGATAAMHRSAEYIKFNENGINAMHFLELARDVGFREVRVTYDWFLGQGSVMHDESPDAAQTVERWARRVLPLSQHLFKYLRFDLVK